jgi:hypothetical protein
MIPSHLTFTQLTIVLRKRRTCASQHRTSPDRRIAAGSATATPALFEEACRGRSGLGLSFSHYQTTKLIAASALAASSMASLWAFARPTPEVPKEADFLFVQGSKGMTFDEATNNLTLTGG